jgi:hypothetical protein
MPCKLQWDMTNSKKIELVFPRAKRNMDMYLPKVKVSEIFSTDIETVGD